MWTVVSSLCSTRRQLASHKTEAFLSVVPPAPVNEVPSVCPTDLQSIRRETFPHKLITANVDRVALQFAVISTGVPAGNFAYVGFKVFTRRGL
jgi:hypothetical protein